MEENLYQKYRGKCKEFSESLCEQDPTLKLVRGHYIDWSWGEQAHWWCEKSDGTIVDPTKDQFPSKGRGEYIPFDGMVSCEQCGKVVHEDEAYIAGSYALCSYSCYGRLIGM